MKDMSRETKFRLVLLELKGRLSHYALEVSSDRDKCLKQADSTLTALMYIGGVITPVRVSYFDNPTKTDSNQKWVQIKSVDSKACINVHVCGRSTFGVYVVTGDTKMARATAMEMLNDPEHNTNTITYDQFKSKYLALVLRYALRPHANLTNNLLKKAYHQHKINFLSQSVVISKKTLSKLEPRGALFFPFPCKKHNFRV